MKKFQQARAKGLYQSLSYRLIEHSNSSKFNSFKKCRDKPNVSV